MIDKPHLQAILTAGILLLSTGCAHQANTSQGHRDPSSMETTRGVMLGVRMGAPGTNLSRAMGIDPATSTIINHVADDTPAIRGGLEQWDLVVAVNGSIDASPEEIRAVLRTSRPGDLLILDLLRKGRPERVGIILEAPDESRMTGR